MKAAVDHSGEPQRSVSHFTDGKIATAVTKCLDLFRRSLVLQEWTKDPTNQSIKSTIQDEETRFKVWAGNIGAHKGGRSSLDYRLRDASHLQKQVLRLLSDLLELHEDVIAIVTEEKIPWDKLDEEPLRDDEDEGFPDDLPDTELGQISTDIVEVVNCLLRLSVSIRNPAPHDRFTASATTDTSHYEHFDTQHVKSKFGSTINDALATRLGKALSRRRQYFRYRESHHAKLSHGLEGGHAKGGEIESTIASSIPHHLKDTPRQQVEVVDEDNRSDTCVSETSFASSAPGTAKLRLPPLPREAERGPFECPFCFMMISATNSVSWKRHVYGDLRPYVCLSEDCQAPDQEYTRRRDWMQHEVQNHWKVYLCSFGCDDGVRYRSAAALRIHFQTKHKTGALTGSGLDALIDLSAQPLRIEDGVPCQLCGETLRSIQSYRRHVGRHQEQLSLFALPDIAHDDGEGEDTDDDISTESDGDELLSHENEEKEPGLNPKDREPTESVADSRESVMSDPLFSESLLGVDAQLAFSDGDNAGNIPNFHPNPSPRRESEYSLAFIISGREEYPETDDVHDTPGETAKLVFDPIRDKFDTNVSGTELGQEGVSDIARQPEDYEKVATLMDLKAKASGTSPGQDVEANDKDNETDPNPTRQAWDSGSSKTGGIDTSRTQRRNMLAAEVEVELRRQIEWEQEQRRKLFSMANDGDDKPSENNDRAEKTQIDPTGYIEPLGVPAPRPLPGDAEDVTIQVKGDSILEVGGARVKVRDGAEITIPRGSSETGFRTSQDQSTYLDEDRRIRIERFQERYRARSQARMSRDDRPASPYDSILPPPYQAYPTVFPSRPPNPNPHDDGELEWTSYPTPPPRNLAWPSQNTDRKSSFPVSDGRRTRVAHVEELDDEGNVIGDLSDLTDAPSAVNLPSTETRISNRRRRTRVALVEDLDDEGNIIKGPFSDLADAHSAVNLPSTETRIPNRRRSPSPERERVRIVEHHRSMSPSSPERVRVRVIEHRRSPSPPERFRIVERRRSPSPIIRERIKITRKKRERSISPQRPEKIEGPAIQREVITHDRIRRSPSPPLRVIERPVRRRSFSPPPPGVIRGPVIEREVITHYRDIDHGAHVSRSPSPPPPPPHIRESEADSDVDIASDKRTASFTTSEQSESTNIAE